MASTIIKNPYTPPIQDSFALADYADVNAAGTAFSSYAPCSGASGVWGVDSFEFADKQFKPQVVTTSSIFIANTTNVSSVDYVRAHLNGHTVQFRLRTYVKVSMTDTAITLGSFNWSMIGYSTSTSSYPTTTLYIPAQTADGSAFVMGYYNSGNLQITDVVPRASATSVSVSAGSTVRVDWQFAVPINNAPGRVADSFCEVGYYLRSTT